MWDGSGRDGTRDRHGPRTRYPSACANRGSALDDDTGGATACSITCLSNARSNIECFEHVTKSQKKCPIDIFSKECIYIESVDSNVYNQDTFIYYDIIMYTIIMYRVGTNV